MARTKSKVSLDLKGHSITRNDTVFVYGIAENVWEMLSEKDRRVFLHGFAQYVGDAVAGMTLKGGYTAEERMTAMVEKAREINEGVFRVKAEGNARFRTVLQSAATCSTKGELKVLRKLGIATKDQLLKLDEIEKAK